MKKTVLALSIIISSLSASAIARDGAYVSGAYSMMYHDSIFNSNNEVKDGYAVAAGYDFAFGSFFSLGTEFEYKNLGSTTESIGSDSIKVAMVSMGVNLVPKVYLGDNFNLLAKLGYHKIDVDVTTTFASPSPSAKASDNATLIGLGLGYDFNSHLALQTTYEIHNISGYNTASANVGIKFSF